MIHGSTSGSATGSEILKNLVLPGLGSFTIVDASITQGQDLGNNFFLTLESLGKPRGEEIAKYLGQLNPDVRINAVTQVSI